MQPARRGIFGRLSLIWLVPVVALLISLGVVWQSFADQGRLISITFEDASGIRADETQLRYRDVVVGMVEAVRFTDELDEVVVDVRLDQSVGHYVDEEASFWIVSPEVSAQGVRGLDTVLGGVYIEGSWDGVAGDQQAVFEGLSTAPLRVYGQDGLTFTLRASDVAGLSEDAPILYRGIEVGQIGNIRLAEDGVSVLADAFVQAPQSRLINSATRFWDTSGFSFSFGASGAQLSVNSLSSLLSGGVSFETVVSGGAPIEDESAAFRLFESEEAAFNSVFASNVDGEPTNFTVIFEDSVPGLEVGADVEFGGIVVGRVSGLTGVLDEEQFGDRGVRLLATLEVQPGSMGLDPDVSDAEVYDFMQFAVNNGLRAQLQSASILGGLQVALEQFDDVAPAEFVADADPYPRIPSIEAEVSDFADTAEGVFNRVNNLPIEELLQSAIGVMNSAERLLNEDGVRETPNEVLALLGDVRRLVNSEGIQEIPGQASATMAALQNTAEQLQSVVTQLNEAEAVAALVDALDAAEEAANSVYATMDEGPETLAEINEAVNELTELIATVNQLPLDSVVAETEGTIAALRTLLAADSTQNITSDVSNMLGEVEGLVADVREAGIVENANATLNELQTAVRDLDAELSPLLAEARQTVISARETVDQLPDIAAEVESLTISLDNFVENLNQLPLQSVVENVDTLLASVNGIVADPAFQELPQDVSATLAEAQQLLSELANGGLVAQANSTLAAAQEAITDIQSQLGPILAEAQRAASQVAEATDVVPEIADQAQQIADRVNALVAEAENLPLEEIANRTSALLDTTNSLVAATEEQEVPAALSNTLQEIQRVLIQVQEGGLIENANATLAAAERAAGQVAAASDQLPALLSQVSGLLSQTEAVVSSYQASGVLGSQARQTLREIQSAASSVDSLARQIERSPNSLLFGR